MAKTRGENKDTKRDRELAARERNKKRNKKIKKRVGSIASTVLKGTALLGGPAGLAMGVSGVLERASLRRAKAKSKVKPKRRSK